LRRAKGATKKELDGSATRLLAFLERNRRERIFKYPFGYSYPENACESVSLILAYLLEEKYGLDDIRIIKGSKPCGYEHHFWVCVGYLTYDLTAHQFAGHQPIIGVFTHPLHLDEFPDWSLGADDTFVDRDEVIQLYRQGVVPF
jgi:hypothetical protein